MRCSPSSLTAGTRFCDDDVRDFAISPDGEQLVTHTSDGCIELHELAALLRKPSPEVPVEVLAEVQVAVKAEVKAEVQVAVQEEVEVGGEPSGSSPASMGVDVPALRALEPRDVGR